MKKIIIKTLPIILLSSTSFSMTEGFYAGASVGVLDQISKISVTDIDTTERTVFSVDQGSTGFAGVLALGYTYIMNNFAITVQADANFANSDVNLSVTNVDVLGTNATSFSLKNKSSYGLNVRPAYVANDCLSTYLVLGYRRGNFDASISDVGPGQPAFSISNSFNRNGFEYGVGTEFAINDQLGLRLEMTQTTYQSNTLFSVAGQGSATATNKVNQGLVSLVWYPYIA
ncbi:outer membrane protein [Legionella waltersii]|uniref:Outer membrane protein beta-barrel domain-containing protein n=1 Tax=Legionella waltersii TaxID=66969 RepID=A0A0W1ADH8_9GAMM|nr:outer membrane beta-barrel protein [Legionella waltersii]KTD79393.1 hypothetical protein Lwal_1465 [Legionella waltersii]SNU99610.1 Opacity protein and related surface antigens [Legionella waltersii]